jgi:hypothetical protein
LNLLIGIAAIAAPALHMATDVMEWHQQGFSAAQLWLNYIAFLAMPWILVGLYAAHDPRPGLAGLAGALLYGTAFIYFAHTTLYAIAEHVPSYEALWSRLGNVYTIHGALMVVGGLLFAWSAWQARWLPRGALLLFAAGIFCNLLVALAPVPDIFQTIGSAARNLGLIAMGYAVMVRSRLNESPATRF